MPTISYKFYTVEIYDKKYFVTARSIRKAAEIAGVHPSKVTPGCDILKDEPLPDEYRKDKSNDK